LDNPVKIKNHIR